MDAPPEAPREAPAAPLVDTHAHLNDRRFAGDVAAALERARQAGVCGVVVPGYDLRSSHGAVRLAREHSDVWAAVGVHPHNAKDLTPAALNELCELARQPRVVAIGECGLDFYRNLSPQARQREVFEAQLALAREVTLPVVVHCREAMLQTLEILRAAALPAGGVMHCFDGTVRDALAAVDLGLYISCAGTLTYRRDPTLAQAIAAVPAGRIVVETDSPYLAPRGYRGQRNEPAYVRLVADAAAAVRGVEPATFARATTCNAAALFRTPAMARAPLESVA